MSLSARLSGVFASALPTTVTPGGSPVTAEFATSLQPDHDHFCPEHVWEAVAVGALIMLGTLFGLIVLIFALVLRFDPEARDPLKSKGSDGL